MVNHKVDLNDRSATANINRASGLPSFVYLCPMRHGCRFGPRRKKHDRIFPDLPPLFEGNIPVLILVYIAKKLVQAAVWYSQASLVECSLEFLLVQFPVPIAVYRSEEMIELLFSCFNKHSELWC